jgi:hypothetical protein
VTVSDGDAIERSSPPQGANPWTMCLPCDDPTRIARDVS